MKNVVEAGADVLHHEGELVGGRVAGELPEVDEGSVSATCREERDLPQHIASVGGVFLCDGRMESLDGNDLASGSVARHDDEAEAALAEHARLLVFV
jgi:hypothetical protein